MNKQVALAVVIAALPATAHGVGFPKKATRAVRKSRNVVKRPSNYAAARIDTSPEKMTERFGLSILIREKSQSGENTKFVKQPD